LEVVLGSGGKKRKKGGKATSSVAKGEVVEKVVAMMHERQGLRVSRDVLLPAKDGSRRRRQVDVLVVGSFAGYPEVRVIECKNYGRNVNVRDIGGFRDLMEDVGYSPQQGILVSASGFSPGARTRAQNLGMKTFELQGLTADRLSSALHQATQRVVFAVPALTGFSVIGPPGTGGNASAHEDAVFVDKDGRIVGALPDLVWLRWLDGEPEPVLGSTAWPSRPRAGTVSSAANSCRSSRWRPGLRFMAP